jgi:predicted TIM-barrel fold metal-dependent hydrolase
LSIIDTHAHIYPDAIAGKAAASIGEFYEIPMCLDGTLGTLLSHGDEAGISRFLVHSVAVTWERVSSVNSYLMGTVAQHPDRLIGFGSMHPDHPDCRAELLRIRAGGLMGVKVHPDFQKFELDSPKAIALFREMAELHIPLLSHVGDTRYSFSEPQRMARVMDAVPGLKVIAAHFGGWSVWQTGWQYLAGRPNLWVDCSSSLYALAPEEAMDLIRRYGADRVFFGSDYPMWNPAEELERLRALPLTEEELENILHRNFEAFWQELE